jgi:nitroreductase
MDVEEAIRTRRTHKAFGPQEIPASALSELFELARWAPNHKLTTPWRFRVLGPEARSALMELAEELVRGSASKLRRAPTLVAISACLGGESAQDRDDLLACAAAAYIVLLAAHARGLAGYWRSLPLLEEARARALLELDDGEHPLGLLYLGKPIQEARVPQRPPIDEFVTFLD